MKYIFVLSGDYLDLAKEEVISLFDAKKFKVTGNLLIADIKCDENEIKITSQRLALTKSIYRLLFECKSDELIHSMKKFEWKFVYKGSFCIRISNPKINEKNKKIKNHKISFTEKYLAKYVWDSVSNPKVDLENPKTRIEFFIAGSKVYCGLGIKVMKNKFESRKAHLRPFTHPSSLHPKLSRALVNISGINNEDILLDPFCGTGGFLIEAGLMGIKIIGCDISKSMAKGCKENLQHFNIRNFKIINKNALQINQKLDYVVTDLPYGLNSNVYLRYNKKSIYKNSNKINLKLKQKNQIRNIEIFYLRFLKKLKSVLRKKAVIIFPNFVDYRKLIKNSKFIIEKEFSIPVHRSLTRKIVRIKS